ncbi:MAG: hypothetical protein JWN98_1652 [Abditibacteriota bacterium]|nr:hypothetical protein [Abditibacteriota bacterium]
MKLPVIVLGGGGHAKVLWDTLQLCSVEIIGYTDPQAPQSQSIGQSPMWLGADEIISSYSPDSVLLVNGLGSAGAPTLRKRIFDQWQKRGYTFASVVHPSAIVAQSAQIGEGAQIMAGAIIQAGAVVGNNCIINTRGSIDHDCVLGHHVHIAPGATLSGDVRVGDEVHIGTGATVIQNRVIAANAIVGAGAVVVHDVRSGSTVVGVPARSLSKSEEK